MSTLTYAFTGPDGQTVAASGGRVVVRVWDVAILVALYDAADDPVRVTVTGPFVGGEGLEDPASAYYAARATLPEAWEFSGGVPPWPEIGPTPPGIVCAPPAA